MVLALAPSSPTTVSALPPSLGSKISDVAGQVQAAIANGGYVETDNSYRVFAFVGGRLTQAGVVTDLTLVVPTHDETGLKPATLPKTPPVVSPQQLQSLANEPEPPYVTPQTIRNSLITVDQKLAAARATDPNSAYAQELEAQDVALRNALSEVQIAPTNYGGQAEIRGILGNALT